MMSLEEANEIMETVNSIRGGLDDLELQVQTLCPQLLTATETLFPRERENLVGGGNFAVSQERFKNLS